MSHASVLVAISKEQLNEVDGDVHQAVALQMEPFDENGEFFKDGSRWDWWVIGGRFSAMFSEPGYDPEKDPRNQIKCYLCNGSGRRDDEIGRKHRESDPNYGCNGCDGHPGIMIRHPSELADVGNIILRKDISLENWKADHLITAERSWKEYEARKAIGQDLGRVYGVLPDDTRESYVTRKANKPISFYAFLKDKCWHEFGRMGWSASNISTECELKAEAAGIEPTRGRCITTDEKTGAKIYSWNKSSALNDNEDVLEEEWGRLYFDRFLKDLPEDTTLVVVDYHV